MSSRSMSGLKFVQGYLPEHLQAYAHLIPSVVNDCVGWLGKEEKQLALLIGIATLEKAWSKWQEEQAIYTETQFFSYAKKRIWGAIMDHYKNEIEIRKLVAQEIKRICEEKEKDKLELEQEVVKTVKQSAINGYILPENKPRSQSHGNFIPNENPSLNQMLRDIPYENRHDDEDYYLFDHYDPEYDTWDNELVDEDGERGFGGSSSAGSSRHILKLYRLLPTRESLALRLRRQPDNTFEFIGEILGVSRARAQQICEQAEERFQKNLIRLAQGEEATVLLKEADHLSITAEKKSRSILAKKALPFTNTLKDDDLL